MYAWVIREERLGVPEKAMQIEKMPVQKPKKRRSPSYGYGSWHKLQ